MATFNAFVYLLFGVLVFGLDLGQANLLPAILTILLAVASFLPFGIISASFVLVFKRGDPITFAVGTLSSLLGGMFYPTTVLPEFLEKVSYFLPITHALRAMRLALLRGASQGEIMPDLVFLAVFSGLAIPVSVGIFKLALRQAMRRGTLTHY